MNTCEVIKMSEAVQGGYRALFEHLQSVDQKDQYRLFGSRFVRSSSKNPIMFVGRDTRGLEEEPPIPDGYEIDDMEWLSPGGGYPFTKSPFWRVIGKALSQSCDRLCCEEIFSGILWSNLYKMGYQARKAISGKRKEAQRALCAELLYNEIVDLAPSAVVFLTGDDINWFLDAGWIERDRVAVKWRFGEGKKGPDRDTPPASVRFDFKVRGKTIPAFAIEHPQGKKECPRAQLIADFLVQVGAR